LLKLKDQKTTSKSTELVITGVFPKHDDVVGHRKYTTLKDMEDKKVKKEEREESERRKVKEIVVKEAWKAWQTTVRFFEEAGGR
jgi:translation initiation factor 2D